MKISSGRDPVMVRLPITGGGTLIVDGAQITRGLTGNLGRMTISPEDGADSVGILRGPHATADDSLLLGTTWTFADVELHDQYNLVEVEYSQVSAEQIDVASVTTTVITITSIEDNIDGGWLFSVAGTANNLLAYLTASSSTTATSKTATGWDSTTNVIKILPVGAILGSMNATRDLMGSQAAVGTWTIFNLENYFLDDTFPKTLMDPTIHDNLTLSNARFFSRLLVRNTAGHTID